jgi:hypothetical protein
MPALAAVKKVAQSGAAATPTPNFMARSASTDGMAARKDVNSWTLMRFSRP